MLRFECSQLPIGFEGGHGTAAGLSESFTALGWPAGGSFSLASATVGIVSGILVGIVLVNWGVSSGKVGKPELEGQRRDSLFLAGVYNPSQERPIAGHLTVSSDSIDTLSLHLAFTGVPLGCMQVGMLCTIPSRTRPALRMRAFRSSGAVGLTSAYACTA